MAPTLAATYLGLIIEQRYMGTRKYKEFMKTSPFKTMKRVIFCTLIGCPTLAGMILCPKTGIHWIYKLLFKSVIPCLLGQFYLFAFSKYIALKANLINDTVFESSDDEQDQKKTQ